MKMPRLSGACGQRRVTLLFRAWVALMVLATWSWLSFPLTIPYSQAASVNYVYDDAGRLIAVIDPAGDTARYTYDAVGNLLEITRYSSALISLLDFTPKSGPIGTVVTIYGTGFRPTANDNTVTFNGVVAGVTSATATQLVTSVPAGATTGPITVTTPTGSATSSAVFTVTSGADPTSAPTITSFTPTIGAPGTAVTITGTNFAPTPEDNQVIFTATQSTVTAATSTNLTADVPAVRASGRISVSTTAGTAVSSDDFFIPPAPYTAADVAMTGRMAIGQSKIVTVSTANKIALIVFDGIASQRISMHITGSTISSTTVSLTDPYGTALFTSSFSGAGTFIEPRMLPTTGTYTIRIDPLSTHTGSLTLVLYDVPADVADTVTPGGPAVSVTTTVPGQNALLTFDGTTGQRVSVLMSNSTFGSQCLDLSILDPIGATVVFAPCTNGFIEPQTLPATGTYTLVVKPRGATTGSATFTVYDVPPDVTDPITPGGPAVTVSLTTPGQNAELPFAGTAGQRVSILIHTSTLTNCQQAGFGIRKPDGTNLVGQSPVCTGNFIDARTLPTTGTYTLYVNPSGMVTGEVTLTLYEVPPDVSEPITPGGPAVTVDITTPGQNAGLTFTGTAGQWVSVLVNNSTFANCSAAGTVKILKPDGTTLVSSSGCTNVFIDVQTLPETGTYTLFVNPFQANTGQSTLTLYDVPADVTGTLIVNDPAVGVTMTTPGQNGQLTFAGAANQQVTVRVTTNTIGTVTVRLLKPDTSVLASSTSSSANFNLPSKTLPTTGTYTVTIDPSGSRTGSLNVQVTSP
jgi:YD repeat-containing protein